MTKRRSVRFDVYRDMRAVERDEKMRSNISLPKVGGKIFRGLKRQHVIDEIMDVMSDWRTTPFENEGPVTQGIRSSLCLAGHAWEKADSEARTIVSDCLSKLGAIRPTFEQGQREYSISLEQCAWCYGSIPEELAVGSNVHRYCSDVCARSAIQYRDFNIRSNADASFRAASATIARASRPTVECQHCAKKFKPTQSGAKFCSPACSQEASALNLRMLPDRECLECGKTFRPERDEQRFCSHACYSNNLKSREIEKACACCGGTFVAGTPKALYCSMNCASVVSRFRTGRNLPKRITPPVLDYLFRQQGLRITTERIAAYSWRGAVNPIR